VSDVLSRFDKGDVRVKVADLDKAAQVIAEAGLPVRVQSDHIVVSDLADPAWITEALAKRRMYVSELTPLLPNLENVFLDLTGTVPAPDGHRQVDEAYRPPDAATLQILEPSATPQSPAPPSDPPRVSDAEAVEPAGTTGPGTSGDEAAGMADDDQSSRLDPAVPAQPSGPHTDPELSRAAGEEELPR